MRNPLEALRERFGDRKAENEVPEDKKVEFTGAVPDPHDGFPRLDEPDFRVFPSREEAPSDVLTEFAPMTEVEFAEMETALGVRKAEDLLPGPPPDKAVLTEGDQLLQAIATEFILICSSPDCDGTCLWLDPVDGEWKKEFSATTEEQLDEFAGGSQVRCNKCGGWQDRKHCELYAT
jgi:hypothetical protein